MGFRIDEMSLEDFLKGIKQIEFSTHFDRNVLQRGRNNDYDFSELGYNVEQNGQKIFALKLREDKPVEKEDPLYRIPIGNYYLEFYYYRRKKGALTQSTTGLVDLKWNQNGKLTKVGYQPLYLLQEDFERIKKNKSKELILLTAERMLYNCVIDRLKQICSNKLAAHDPHLLSESIRYALGKYCESFSGNKENYALKILNRVIVIPNSANEANDYSWKWNQYRNKHGTFSDCLSQTDSVDPDLVRNILEYFDNKIILGEASEEGGRKGTFIFLNEGLQQERNQGWGFYSSSYQGLMHGKSFNEGNTYTIFKDREKYFARSKTFMTSDGAAVYDIKAIKEDSQGNKLFDRNKIYLSGKSSDIGYADPTVINMVVAYVPIGDDAKSVSLEEFKDCDKNRYSKSLHGADCHIDISEEAAKTLVVNNRKISYPITDENFSLEFLEVIEKLKTESRVEVEPDFIVGYKTVCDQEFCRTTMSPVKQDGPPINGELHFISIIPDSTTDHWFCNLCNTYNRKKGEAIRLNHKHQTAVKFIIGGVNIDENSEINIDANVVLPIGISRSISVEGMKGLTVPAGQDFIGYISGEIYNPATESYQKLELTPLDLSMNMGSMKGKVSGVALTHIRMLNALTESKITPDEIYLEEKSLESVNELLKKCKKVQLRRRVYSSDTNSFEWRTEEVYAGVISIDVTEIGDEFLKVKTDVDDMKVSHMNSMFYNYLGFDDLSKAMSNASLEGFNNQDNKEFAIELFKMLYADPEGLQEVKHTVNLGENYVSDKTKSDFNNPNGSINIVSWLEKSEWQKVLQYHPLLSEKSKFTNGAYYVDRNGNKVVFPSRKTIIRLVDIMNNGRVRLHGIVKIALSMFLGIYSKGTIDRIPAYRQSIFEKLTGKHGILARSSTFVNFGGSGKETGCGYIPTGVIVVGDPNFEHMIKKNLSKIGLKWEDICSGKSKLYGASQRDPFIWLFQALNAVEIWPIARANTYFQEEYGITFSEMYPNFNSIMLNVTDMLHHYQADADGDLRRLLVAFDVNVQTEMSKMNNQMKNYDLICKADPESQIGKMYARIGSWHLNYVKAEAESAANRLNGYLEITIKEFRYADKNALILKNIKSKGNIGIITTSQWKIQALADYLLQKKEKIIKSKDGTYVPLTEDDRNAICLFYQTCFTQDGCVRSLKGDKNLGDYNLDKIAVNMIVEEEDLNGTIEISLREKIREEAEKNGYTDIVEKFFAIADYWKVIAGLDVNKDGSLKSTDLIMPEAEMLNAYIAVCNGSRYMSKDPYGMFEKLVIDQSKYVTDKMFIQPLVPYLESVVARKKEAKKA